MKVKASLIIAACVIRVLSQAISPYWGGAAAYFIGQAIFEVLIMAVLVSLSEGTLQLILSFFLGMCAYNLFKEIFLDPTKVDRAEYIGALVGLFFLLFTLYRHARNKRAN